MERMTKCELEYVRSSIRWAHHALRVEQSAPDVVQVRSHGVREDISIDFRDIKRRHPVMNRGFFRVHGREVRVSKSSIPVHPNTLKQRPWVIACRSLPGLQHVWVRCCYINGRAVDWSDLKALALFVWEHVSAQLPKKMTDSRKNKIKHLVTLGIYNVHSKCSAGKKLYSVEEIKTLVDAGNWGRDYQPFWKLIDQVLMDLDRQALEHLQKTIDLREGELCA